MRKNQRRQSRLQSGASWIKKYEGKSLINGYSKKYGVDKFCAIKELRILGVDISQEYEHNLRKTIEAEKRQKQERKEKKEREFKMFLNSSNDSDDQYAMIMGYTSGGAPFGITHEEYDEILKEQIEDSKAHFKNQKTLEMENNKDEDELPF